MTIKISYDETIDIMKNIVEQDIGPSVKNNKKRSAIYLAIEALKVCKELEEKDLFAKERRN